MEKAISKKKTEMFDPIAECFKNEATTINNEEPLDEELMMISNI